MQDFSSLAKIRDFTRRLRLCFRLLLRNECVIVCCSLGSRMMGAKKGGNDGSQMSAGAIKEAGGAFAKLEVAHEEEYFYKARILPAFGRH